MKLRFAQGMEENGGREPHPPLTDEALAEVVREELFAAVTLSRSLLLRRVAARTLSPTTTIRAVVERLGAIGDLTEGDGGILASAPMRLIDRGAARGYWLGTAPLRWLHRRAPAIEIEDGWPRSVILNAPVREALGELGGVLIPVAGWAGIEETTPSSAWLEEQRCRLEQAPQVNGALLPEALSPTYHLGSARWLKGPPPGDQLALLRWTELGYPRWGVAQGSRLVTLSADEARRGMLALRESVGQPALFRCLSNALMEEVTIEDWLPAAEWRLLVGLASKVERRGRQVVAELPHEVAQQLKNALGRAGLHEKSQEETG